MASQKRRGKYFEDRVVNLIRKKLKLKKADIHRYYESGAATGEYGDIKTDLPFIFECKYYKDIDITKLLFNKPKRYYEWLIHLENDVIKYNEVYNSLRIPVLVFSKPNDRNIYTLVIKKSNKFDYEQYHPTFYNQLSANEFAYFIIINTYKCIFSTLDIMLDAYKTTLKGGK